MHEQEVQDAITDILLCHSGDVGEQIAQQAGTETDIAPLIVGAMAGTPGFEDFAIKVVQDILWQGLPVDEGIIITFNAGKVDAGALLRDIIATSK